MDPDQIATVASTPGMVETINAVIAAAVALVTGVAGSLLAIFKFGVGKMDTGKQSEVLQKQKELLQNQKELIRDFRDFVSALNEVKKVSDAYALTRDEHERMVSELHSALMDPSREVQRLLSVQEAKDMRMQLKELEEIMKTHMLDDVAMSKAIGNISESVDIIARKLRELSS
tara:strand:+ start:165 stop:683 length:519 start_codon:yes stop_codon:yes gene_type:complete